MRGIRDVDERAKTEAAAFLSSHSAKGGTVLAPALNTAYRYGDPDRPLNVVILSDGMTEQKERRVLIQLIHQRPSHARVFCIGIGNEINRPLLEQMAEDSGGLAAFVSGGDNFTRQAKAFRRKLLRPAVSDLSLEFDGIDVYDRTPVQLPNLYFGSPVRIYGRYKGSGEGGITLSGQVMGREITKTMSLPFPEKDLENPEIERMWAQKRIDQLLKRADRTHDRTSIIDEVVQLGEDFSIVTEYTSFIVLENDEEYKRWKIERRNLKRIKRDRTAQAKRMEALASIREKALGNLGPQAASQAVPETKRKNNQPATRTVQAPDTVQQPNPTPTATRQQSQNFSFGSGPVGPLFVGLAILMRRRKKRTC